MQCNKDTRSTCNLPDQSNVIRKWDHEKVDSFLENVSNANLNDLNDSIDNENIDVINDKLVNILIHAAKTTLGTYRIRTDKKTSRSRDSCSWFDFTCKQSRSEGNT